jgi:signal transduction histidine kinase/CheY-like chemotaxis protein
MRIRRQYNKWVADQSLEDYALRFTGFAGRRWSHARVANTAIGSISFLALEAIGGLTTLQCGFFNAALAITVVCTLIFLTSLVVGYYAANYGLDIDLLTRGAGFGYLGSALSSLVYAILTFVFFAIEASIMAVALERGFGMPLPLGYALSSIIIIPIVAYGITLISRLQLWTQPLWTALQLAPFLAIAWKAPDAFRQWTEFTGLSNTTGGFSLALFGSAASVVFSLMGQIGEQADFLRFMPPKDGSSFDWRWWSAMLVGGPGWILVGGAKMFAGSMLVVVALNQGLSPVEAAEPVDMYRVGFGFVFGSSQLTLAATVAFVIVSQVKINVTNAYAGSIAWSNFFARLTHSHPGRVVWLIFNVAISLLITQLGAYHALGAILSVYSNLAVAWIGALVGDLALNKPIGLSPKGIEFKRAYLPGANPVGFGAMSLATVLAFLAFTGFLGPRAEALAGFIGLFTAFAATPVLAFLTGGRYYLARQPDPAHSVSRRQTCCVCEYTFDQPDMAHCPAYEGPICSLCCTLDARCGDRCKPSQRQVEQMSELLGEAKGGEATLISRRWALNYGTVFLSLTALVGCIVSFVNLQARATHPEELALIATMSWTTFWALVVCGAVGAWMIVLARDSRRLAQWESERQTSLLIEEIEAHRHTDAALQATNDELKRAKEAAEAANLAKSRYVIGMSHELRSPLNAVLGYAQILTNDRSIPPGRSNAINTVRRSAEHMSGLVDGLLDISKIESGLLYLRREEVALRDALQELGDMFRIQANTKGLEFDCAIDSNVPEVVYGDGRRLRQILINLLSNAVKYTQRGRIQVHAHYRNMFAEIEVTDTGCGIDLYDQARIFEPFERAKQPRGQAAPGTGLGLTITKMLVHIMGGEISLKSAPGEGSAFKVRLLLTEVTHPRAKPDTSRQIVGYRGSRRTIIVADDDPSHCAIMVELLGRIGLVVIVAETGPQCLNLARDSQPDLVLLDVSMPGMNGWEVAQELRSSVSPSSRIVMLSGNAHEIDTHRDSAKHHDAEHIKPFIADSLLQTLGELLGLEWILAKDEIIINSDAVAAAAGDRSTIEILPSLRELDDLRRLGEIGYVRGIRQKLSDLATQSDDYAWLVAKLEPMFRNLDFQGYIEVLSDLIERAGGR